MKKIFIFNVLILLLLVISGCDDNDATGAGPTETTPIETPPPETTPPVDTSGLPPDPGEAGKQTLVGIDSDGDGLRDDVQRFIAINYADASEPVKRAIVSRAKGLQGLILAADSKELAMAAARELGVKGIDCLYYHQYAGVRDVGSNLKSAVVNTEARLRAYIHNDALLGGETFSIPSDAELAEICQ